MKSLAELENNWPDIDPNSSEQLLKKTLDQAIERIGLNIERFGDKYPYVGEGNKYKLANNDNWVTGYSTALFWLAFYQTGDDKFYQAASAQFKSYEDRLLTEYIHGHEVGHVYDMAAARGHMITGEDKWKFLGLRASAILTLRFHQKGQYLQTFGFPGVKDLETGRTIIDSLCTIPLWYWAAEVSGDEYYTEIAHRQVSTVLKRLVRDDGSSGHTFLFDPETEEPLGIRTMQGLSDDSTWSRGQAWAILGFTLAYAYTKDETFLQTSHKMLDWFIDHLGSDIVPPWDFSAPDEERDTSALVIAVNGILRLAALPSTSPADREKYRLFSTKAMVALIERHSGLTDPEGWGLLKDCVYFKAKNRGLNQYSIWGDYYFFENLLILAGRNPLELEKEFK